MARNVLARWGRRRLLEKIAVQKFDFIYLNSLVLHSLIDPDLPFIIHVREIYDGENSEVAKSLAKAHGVIFIDSATRAAFPQLSAPWVILNNPFNMQAADVDSAKSMARRLALGNCTVFTLIGMMNENKGTDFVIDAFNRADRDDAVLLVVGGGTESYEKYCRKLAGGSPRIIFHGFEEDVASIYAVSDYIIRGEAYPCIGRTIYEGLYSGCAVVIPGDAATARDMFEYDRFNEKVYFYAPRQLEAIVSLFQNLKKLNIRGQASMPNVSEFINNFDAFIGTVLGGYAPIRMAGAISGASSLE